MEPRRWHGVNLGDEPLYPRVPLQKTTVTNMWERFALRFVDVQVTHFEGTTLVTKTLFGKLYVISHYVNPPIGYNCPCSVVPIEPMQVVLEFYNGFKLPPIRKKY